MKKRLFILLMLFAVVLVSCTPAAAPTEAATAVPTETAVPVEAAPTQDPAQSANIPSGPATCKAGSAPLPLPEISDQDWSVGPVDAKITILEYSDYQ